MLAVSTLNAQMVKSNRVTSLKHVSCLHFPLEMAEEVWLYLKESFCQLPKFRDGSAGYESQFVIADLLAFKLFHFGFLAFWPFGLSVFLFLSFISPRRGKCCGFLEKN